VTAWTAFASVAGVVTVLLLLLSHSTSQGFDESADPSAEGVLTEHDERRSDSRGAGRTDATAANDGPRPPSDVARADAGVARSDPDWSAHESSGDAAERDSVRDQSPGSDRVRDQSPGDESVRGDGDVAFPGGREEALARESSGTQSLSQPLLLLNVALSQGLFAVVLVAAAVLGAVPRAALGVGDPQLSGWLAIVGVVLGVALYGANEAGGRLADAAGLGRSEDVRELLTPNSRSGWVVLLGGVLPIVAGFEELLFRGVLVGAFATGFGVSPWVLVLASSMLFGLGHGAQGRLGVLVTGTLGVVLGATFVLTESLLVVVVAHYLVNALEFVVHEGVRG
jgi:membrane protease YdiL (CAAX protease family)